MIPVLRNIPYNKDSRSAIKTESSEIFEGWKYLFESLD